jgi:hypothetical protein
MSSLVGNKPNQVPTNGDLGTLAFQDATSVLVGELSTTGSVEIGTTIPVTTNGTNLNIYGASASNLSLQNNTSGTGNGNGFQLIQDGVITYLQNRENGAMTFATNNTERMRLDSSGNLGLGVTPSAWNSSYSAFQSRNAAFWGTVSVTEAAMSANVVIGASSTTYISTGAASVYQQVTGQHRWYNAPSGTAGAAITLTQAMTLNASGNLLVGTTSATSGGAKLQTVDGITFPATPVESANANTLDDYEEGTFTPAVEGTTTAGTGTYSSRVGRYTKIGNTVFYQIWINMSAHTGTGNMIVTSLPFTSNSSTPYGSVTFQQVNSLTLPVSTALMGYIANSSTAIALQTLSIAGGGTVAALALDAVCAFNISGFYTV